MMNNDHNIVEPTLAVSVDQTVDTTAADHPLAMIPDGCGDGCGDASADVGQSSPNILTRSRGKPASPHAAPDDDGSTIEESSATDHRPPSTDGHATVLSTINPRSRSRIRAAEPASEDGPLNGQNAIPSPAPNSSSDR